MHCDAAVRWYYAEGDVYRFSSVFTNVFDSSLPMLPVLMLVARMFDVVTDPLMGTLADRTQSRLVPIVPGSSMGAVPFGLIFALLYTPDFILWASESMFMPSIC